MYCCPSDVCRPMLKYAAVEYQPIQGRARDQLSEDERPVYDKFNDCQFIEMLVKLMSLEENKGKDRFHAKHFTLFKVHSLTLTLCILLLFEMTLRCP